MTGPIAPPTGLRERKKARTRAAIEAAALDLFTRQGFEATTVEEIAAAAEVSPRTFFRYFETKDDVVVGASRDHLALVTERLREEPPDAPLVPILERLLQDVAATYDVDRPRLLTRARLVSESPTLRARAADRQRADEQTLAAALRPRLAHLPDADRRARLTAALCLAAMRVAIDLWLEGGGTDDLPARVDEHLRLVEPAVDALGA